MAYDTNKMPKNLNQWNELIAAKTNESKAAYDAAIAEAKAQAEAAYAKLPDSDDKPSLAEYIAQAESMVEPLKNKAYWEDHFRAAGYYPQPVDAWQEPELTPEQELAQERSMIDAETSGAILAGFDYEINGESLHFNYDSFDQQNFADTANACLMKQAGAQGLPETISWNAYRHDGSLVRLTMTADEFLALYAGGALAHKAACMEAGGQKKAALA